MNAIAQSTSVAAAGPRTVLFLILSGALTVLIGAVGIWLNTLTDQPLATFKIVLNAVIVVCGVAQFGLAGVWLRHLRNKTTRLGKG